MTFADKLKNLMNELDLTQAKLANLTGIGKSSISQYLSGKNEPSKSRKREIARTLGVNETYFETFDEAATIRTEDEVVNVPVTLAAKLMNKSKEWVMQGLQNGVFPCNMIVNSENTINCDAVGIAFFAGGVCATETFIINDESNE